MKVIGLDLAGMAKNPTGFCQLMAFAEKEVITSLMHSDEEILEEIRAIGPDMVAIDAPLDVPVGARRCDTELAEYGVLPASLPGMMTLAKRGLRISKSLKRESIPFCEVSSRASSRILGIYNKDDFSMQKNMMSLDLAGDMNRKILSRDELDSIVCALTGYLHLSGSSKTVGDDAGTIVIPLV